MENPANFFREEAVELLATLEYNLLDLVKNPANLDVINEVFRALHTLKGSGSMFGFNDLAAFVHNIENIFDRVRKGEIALEEDLINLTLEARDLMKLLMAPAGDVPPASRRRINELTEIFTLLTDGSSPGTHDVSVSALSAPATVKEISSTPLNTAFANHFRLSFIPHPDFFASGNNPLNLLNELATMGRLSIFPMVDAVPALDTIDAEKCYLAWNLELFTDQDMNTVRDVFMFVEDICDLKIETVSSSPKEPITSAVLSDVQSGLSENSVKAADRGVTRSRGSDAQIDVNAMADIKVDASKLERLISLLGELVTIQSRLSQAADSRGDTEMISIAQELDSLTGELRDNALKLSMLPIDSIFSRLERYGETESAACNRLVRFKFSGGETELDKGVLSKLFEPLTTLIRFCIRQSHEDTARRLELKKDPRALISVAAWHSSGNVCVSVEDDGQGAEMPAGEANELSRTQKVIEELRGNLDVKLTPGKSTSFVIKLPLNLAIIEGLMIRLNERLFVFPLSLVEECIELTVADEEKHYNKNVVMVRGQIVPFISLREKFDVTGSPPPVQQVVIINQSGRRVGFAVDQVVGEYQTVIKSWGKFCSQTQGITGATILGDGNIALIVDLPVLIEEEKNDLGLEGEL